MSATIPTTEPTIIRAGDSAKWTRSFAEYPASEGWSLAYSLINSANVYKFDATADGDAFSIEVAATSTATWTPGAYDLYARLTSEAGDVITLPAVDVQVLPNITAPIDTRTHEEKMLDAITLVLEGKATTDVLDYSINGRSARRMTLEELRKEQQRLIWLVRRQRGTAPNSVGITFGRPR